MNVAALPHEVSWLSIVSPSSLFRFLPFFISVHGLHGGTVTPCFRAHLINLSSSRHLLVGSSHSAPTQSLHTSAWRLRKKMTHFTSFKWPYAVFYYTSWPRLAIDVVKEQFCLVTPISLSQTSKGDHQKQFCLSSSFWHEVREWMFS